MVWYVWLTCAVGSIRTRIERRWWIFRQRSLVLFFFLAFQCNTFLVSFDSIYCLNHHSITILYMWSKILHLLLWGDLYISFFWALFDPIFPIRNCIELYRSSRAHTFLPLYIGILKFLERFRFSNLKSSKS